MKLKMLSAIGVACTLAACAENPDNIRAGYTSAATYQNMSCQQLASEAITVSNRAHDAANVQRRHQTRDEVAMAAGLVVFWPALLFVHGNDQTTSEVAQLRGQMQAIEQVSAAKNCGMVFQRT
ncbi:hypothetical protein JWJ88_15375 [Paracoccus methylovorus]|jgi:hypothetical protein|uniref:Lipoprotein, putative n=3 Tax=Paracoccus TaxID=265 RepID=A1B6M1_PARDP|nr:MULTISPECIES: hypothetical protein [Paracoccus]ABL71165.1 lipoprotein, putative [Paracoccus denitrificans PD1222]MBB4628230.1 hypothetical protein [Paracoccus denitrificans]MCU7429294.1 hypothetical protein [Paracoccus denitrificans]MDK8873282.1 hypothetical protein [Paracoccus sp. SSJ]QAR27811.1 hypothetical protein EO213_15720 [Paracoccus denitrificans]